LRLLLQNVKGLTFFGTHGMYVSLCYTNEFESSPVKHYLASVKSNYLISVPTLVRVLDTFLSLAHTSLPSQTSPRSVYPFFTARRYASAVYMLSSSIRPVRHKPVFIETSRWIQLVFGVGAFLTYPKLCCMEFRDLQK